MSATTTQPLSSGEFCKLRCDTIPVKSASANVSFYTNNSKIPDFELWHSCRKWAIFLFIFHCTTLRNIRFQAGVNELSRLYSVPIDPETHAASYSMRTWSCFLRK